jgi:ribosome-binding factor A
LLEDYLDENGDVRIAGVFIPADYEHLIINPHGKKSKREELQEKRLQNSQYKANLSKVKKDRDKKKLSIRQIRISNLVKDELDNTIADFKASKELETLFKTAQILIEDVQMTGDLRRADILWSVMHSKYEKEVAKQLKKPKVVAAIRYNLTQRTRDLKFSPELRFIHVSEIEKQEDDLLKRKLDALEKEFGHLQTQQPNDSTGQEKK